AGIATPSRWAGVKTNCLTSDNARASSSGPPDVTTSASLTAPSLEMVTLSSTSEAAVCSPVAASPVGASGSAVGSAVDVAATGNGLTGGVYSNFGGTITGLRG